MKILKCADNSNFAATDEIAIVNGGINLISRLILNIIQYMKI